MTNRETQEPKTQTPFAHLIPAARAFLSDLDRNNTRDWFTANKARYDADLKGPAHHLLEAVRSDLAQTQNQTVTVKLFRPHRDLRFSRDPTPYHTHLHMLWQVNGTGAPQPAYFFGVSPQSVRIGGGVMTLEKTALARYRGHVAADAGDALTEALEAVATAGFVPQPPELVRTPAPHSADHRHEALLRRKSLTVWTDLPPALWPDPQHAILTGIAQMQPVIRWLTTHITA